MARAAFTISTFLVALSLLHGAGGIALAKQGRKQARSVGATLLSLESPGLSDEQRKYLDGGLAESGMRRTKRAGRLTYLVGPKGVRLDGRQVTFHDKRDSIMFFMNPQLALDRKRDCLSPRSSDLRTPKCIPEGEGRTVVYDEVWEDVPPSDIWGRVYWKVGKFVLAVAFRDDDLTMVFERDWCVAAATCTAEP